MGISSPSKSWLPTRNGRIATFMGFLAMFGLAFWLSSKSRQMLATPPPLSVDEKYLSFGETWENPAFTWTLPIQNKTQEDIEIDGFSSSCSCANVVPESLTVPAQGTAEVHLSLNLRTPHTEPDLTANDFQVYVQPKVKRGPEMNQGWVIRGKVVLPFTMEPAVVDFEDSLVRGQPFTPRQATITCGMDVTGLAARSDSPFIMAKLTPDRRIPRRFQLEVQAAKNTPAGAFNQSVRLAGSMADGKEIHGMVPVAGHVLEDIGLQPDLLAFGAEPVGATLHETVTIQSRSGQDFAIQEIVKVESGRIAVDLGPKRKDGSQSLLVSYSVEKRGHQESTIYVKVKTPKNLLDLPMRLYCYGIPARPTVPGQ